MTSYKITAFLVVMTFFCFFPVYSQTPGGEISGFVVDAKTNEPVVFATIVLKRAKDSVLVKTELTEEDGTFIFSNIKNNTYFITIIMDGYSELDTGRITIDESNLKEELPEIKLIPAFQEQALDEVVVTLKKSFVERKIDRTVLNVDALISNTGTTAFELLGKSPGVNVTPEGVISLRGKAGVVIFVNDKPTFLSGNDLENYLNAIPSSAIDKIEIMTNPPAKYDAAGNAGVINIIMKKNRADGFNGNLTQSVTRSVFTKTNTGLNFNYRKGKFNFFGNLSGGYRKRFQDLDINRRTLDENNEILAFNNQNTYSEGSGRVINFKTGVDFYATEKQTWGLIFNGLDWDGDNVDDSETDLLNASREVDSLVLARNITQTKFRNFGVNLYYQYKINEGENLSFDLDYLRYTNDDTQEFRNRVINPADNTTTEDFLDGDLPASIDIYSARADYSKDLGESWKLSTGIKTSFIDTDNVADYIETINNVSRPDFEKSNQFLYEEMINAVYINANYEGKRLSVQAGLRFENTISDGNQLGNEVIPQRDFNRDYTSLFPTLYVSYKLDSLADNTIGINYGKRINRPNFRDLNPIIFPLNRFTFYEGNPFLRPSFTHSVELFYNYKNLLTLTLSYSNTSDEVNETIEIVDEIYFSRPGNIGEAEVWNFTVNTNVDIFKWLTFTNYFAITHKRSRAELFMRDLDVSGTFLSFDPVLQLKFGNDWSGEISGSYIGKVYDAQLITDPFGFVNLGIQKKISNNSTLKLAANDIFETIVNSGRILNLDQTSANFRNVYDSRQVTLTFTYNFGKMASNVRKRKQTGAESEKRRAGN